MPPDIESRTKAAGLGEGIGDSTPIVGGEEGERKERIVISSFGSRFSATTRLLSSVTVTTLLFECRSIPL